MKEEGGAKKEQTRWGGKHAKTYPLPGEIDWVKAPSQETHYN